MQAKEEAIKEMLFSSESREEKLKKRISDLETQVFQLERFCEACTHTIETSEKTSEAREAALKKALTEAENDIRTAKEQMVLYEGLETSLVETRSLYEESEEKRKILMSELERMRRDSEKVMREREELEIRWKRQQQLEYQGLLDENHGLVERCLELEALLKVEREEARSLLEEIDQLQRLLERERNKEPPSLNPDLVDLKRQEWEKERRKKRSLPVKVTNPNPNPNPNPSSLLVKVQMSKP